MSTFTKEQEQYIEHEVRLRMHDEQFQLFEKRQDEQFKLFEKRQDEKFQLFEKRLDKLDHKLNFIFGVLLTAILIPVSLHYFNLI